MARGARRPVAPAPAPVADLLQRPILQLPAQAGQRAVRPRPVAERAHRAQLPAVAALPPPARGHLRAVGDQPLRAAPVRDLLQDVHGEGLGHPLHGAEGGVGGAADQGPLAEDGLPEHVPQAEDDHHDADRGVRLSAPRPRHDVGGRQGCRRAGRRRRAHERGGREDPPDGHEDRRGGGTVGRRRRSSSRARTSSPACR